MLIEIDALRVRVLQCEACEFELSMVMGKDRDPFEVDRCYREYQAHESECDEGKRAVMETILGEIAFWMECPMQSDQWAWAPSFGDDKENKIVGEPMVISVRRPGPIDRRFWDGFALG
jgi:hypothetical protein